jgi:hypothetical protein
MSNGHSTRASLIDGIARIWAASLVAQANRAPQDAARAAGCTTDEDIAAWVNLHASSSAQAA